MKQTHKYLGLVLHNNIINGLILDENKVPFIIGKDEAESVIVRKFSVVGTISEKTYPGYQAIIDAYLNIVNIELSFYNDKKSALCNVEHFNSIASINFENRNNIPKKMYEKLCACASTKNNIGQDFEAIIEYPPPFYPKAPNPPGMVNVSVAHGVEPLYR